MPATLKAWEKGVKVYWLHNGAMQGHIVDILENGSLCVQKKGEKGYSTVLDPSNQNIYRSYEAACFAWDKAEKRRK